MFGVEAHDGCGGADGVKEGSVVCVLCEDGVVLEERARQYTRVAYTYARNTAHLYPSVAIRRVNDPNPRMLLHRVVVNMLYLPRFRGNQSADAMLEHPHVLPKSRHAQEPSVIARPLDLPTHPARRPLARRGPLVGISPHQRATAARNARLDRHDPRRNARLAAVILAYEHRAWRLLTPLEKRLANSGR